MTIYWKKIARCLLLGVAITTWNADLAFSKEKKEQPATDPAAMAVDLFVARPAGALATVFGGAVFVLSSPFSALGGNLEEAWEGMVVAPAEYTFKRPLGEFEAK